MIKHLSPSFSSVEETHSCGFSLKESVPGVERRMDTIQPVSPSCAAMCTQIEHVSNLASAVLTFGSSALWEG